MTWQAFAGQTIYADANVFIYSIEGQNRFTRVLRELFLAAEHGALTVMTSEITIAEVMAKPHMVEATDLIARYDAMFAVPGPLELVGVSRSIIETAARWVGPARLKTVDAIHVATATEGQATSLLSNDGKVVNACRAPVKGIFLGNLVP